ncbi:hypothetical protein H6P81_019380 [Aristolochia fimbriata]|uniref:WD repeat-containing protein 75 second beta-propeller domain-containing protein n=1 Tax=Aristolochia fimbriata TaxID=158543 RepID=A0AAV7DRM5_ARIFI|nr:hypothetical protein H6P81_019380 [Aristolochia fimbriata]
MDSDWDANALLDLYIHDYMKRHNLHEAAATFKAEAGLPSHAVALASPEGFLHDWWSIFYDVFLASEEKYREEAYIKAQQMAMREQQLLHYESGQVQSLGQPRSLQMNHSGGQTSSGGLPMTMTSQANSSTSCLFNAMEEHHKHHSVREPESMSQLVDMNRMTAAKAAIDYQRRMQQQALAQSQQCVARDNGHGTDAVRSLPSETLLYGVPKAVLPRSRFCETGLNKGPKTLPLNGCSIPGIDQIGSSVGVEQLQQINSMLQTPDQLQQLQQSVVRYRPEIFTQPHIHPHGNFVSSLSANCTDVDPRMLLLLRGNLTGQTSQACQQIASSSQMTSVAVRTSQKDENNRKKKQHSCSGSGSSAVAGSIADTLLNLHPIEANLPLNTISNHGDSPESHKAAEKEMKGDSEPTDRVAQTSGQEDVDDEEDGDVNAHCLSLNENSSKSDEPEGFSFDEVGCLHSSTSKVVCCHFSTDGKLLASAGNDKKVTVWNMDTFDFRTTADEHSQLVTDISFKANSTFFASSSFDTTVKVWNAADPVHSLGKLVGHREQVTSLDFHPKKADLLCSCDTYGEIRWWNVAKNSCAHVSKGGKKQVRFEPQIGHLLAAAEDKNINIFSIETDQLLVSLQGHKKEVSSICWHASGDYFASVSEDAVCIWSTGSNWKCIHHLSTNGNKFQSCTFHPRHPLLLVIGGYQSLELWDPVESKIMTSMAHRGLIASLSSSPSTGMVASASHDQCVKLWK